MRKDSSHTPVFVFLQLWYAEWQYQLSKPIVCQKRLGITDIDAYPWTKSIQILLDMGFGSHHDCHGAVTAILS